MVLSRRPAAALAFATVTALAVAVVLPTAAAADESLDAAQQRANQAAAELNRAEVELARMQSEVVRVEARVRDIETRITQTRGQVRDLAMRLYIGGASPISRVLRMADANELVRARQFTSVIAGSSTDALEQFRSDHEDLEDEQRALEASQKAQAAALDGLRQRRTDAVREVERLARIVQEQQERAAREEQQRQAQAQAQARAGGGSPAAASSGSSSGSSPAGSSASPASAAAPSPAAASFSGSGGWVCPVQGPHAFSDDYGASRWGGGSHMGNDILAPMGTPVVANVSGQVTHRNGSVSGLSYFLSGDDGNRYFGAHLNSFGASGRVSAGTVIGTVGNTGDASGGPSHLHFEIHPGGSGYTNPYPTLSRYC